MGSIIRPIGTIFYSLLYLNSRRGFNRLKYLYSVISVIVDSLPANTNNRESTRSWTARKRLVHSWAGHKSLLVCHRSLLVCHRSLLVCHESFGVALSWQDDVIGLFWCIMGFFLRVIGLFLRVVSLFWDAMGLFSLLYHGKMASWVSFDVL